MDKATLVNSSRSEDDEEVGKGYHKEGSIDERFNFEHASSLGTRSGQANQKVPVELSAESPANQTTSILPVIQNDSKMWERRWERLCRETIPQREKGFSVDDFVVHFPRENHLFHHSKYLVFKDFFHKSGQN